MKTFSKKRLRVGIVCAPIHPDYGGPSTVVYSHYKALLRYADVRVFGVVDENQRGLVEDLYPGAVLANRTWPRAWFKGDYLMRMLEDAASEIDIFHVHMLWDYSVYATWKTSTKHNKPFVVTVHGSLSDKWRYSSLHKIIYRRLIVDRVLRDAAAVQALNETESVSIRSVYPNCKILNIPNAIDCDDIESVLSEEDNSNSFASFKGKRVFLYMGRIWGDKGLDILPEAWKVATQKMKNSVLLIVGPDYKNYSDELRKRIIALGLSESVKVLPPVRGIDKYRIMRAASVFLLPSKSEGFSMALLEAAGIGLPSIYSRECNFSEISAVNGGIQISRTVGELAKAIAYMHLVDDSILKEMGCNARALVKAKYDLSNIGMNLLSGYEAILGKLSINAEGF